MEIKNFNIKNELSKPQWEHQSDEAQYFLMRAMHPKANKRAFADELVKSPWLVDYDT